MLEEAGNLSAVVDTDFAVVGDAAFDLVALALSSLTLPCDEGVRDRLRLLDWSIRRHRAEAVEYWLRHAGDLLPP